MIRAGPRKPFVISSEKLLTSPTAYVYIRLMEHPVLNRIRDESFTALGWFEPRVEDGLPTHVKFVILIGNVGPRMFRRFHMERRGRSMDEWTKHTVDALAAGLDAAAVYPFDKPFPPILTWARRAGAGHVSPLGLNIHSIYGLWHAYRAALLFPVAFDLPPHAAGPRPCDTCEEKPCLTACPVQAFDGNSYDVAACAQQLGTPQGQDCMSGGCLARRACPVGQQFRYEAPQLQFHMQAFLKARSEKTT